MHHLYPGDVGAQAQIAAGVLGDVGFSVQERWNAVLSPNVTFDATAKALQFDGQSDFIAFGPTNFGSPLTMIAMVSEARC